MRAVGAGKLRTHEAKTWADMQARDERYRKAQEIAHMLLDRPAAERDSHLAALGDPDLQREVAWLLSAVEGTNLRPGLLERIERERSSYADGARIDVPSPRSYRLLRRIGEGGMGVVWLAERGEDGLRQRVALKRLRIGGGDSLQRRFDEERRILSALTHPNIARLVDAGNDADGEPFLAMEYVEGERIDQWCDAHAADLLARVTLFLKACAAVSYAHERLIIHRDLKPANILVGADGEPKLLDFGIARLLDGSASATATQAMTPAYASPEQIEGAPLGTATDVYSLGVILYELAAGVRPFDDGAGEHARSKAVLSGEITPPSRRTSKQGGSAPLRRIPADLDAIVLKALRREPEQRYRSVAEFADDLRRYLSARPVLARRGQWGYHARRFAWRNRWLLTASAVAMVAGAAFLVEREAQLHRIEVERDRAEAIVGFTGDLFDSAQSLRSRGNAVTVREMLDRGATMLARRDDLPPDLRASLLLTTGRAYNSLGLGQEALPLLQAAQTLDTHAGPAERASLLSALGAAQHLRGLYPEAIATLAQALELLRRSPGDHADGIDELRVRIAAMHADLVDVPIERSIAELQEVLAELQRRPAHAAELELRAYGALSQAYFVANDTAHAIPAAEQSAALAARLYDASDARASNARRQLALALMDADPARAATLFGELIADYDRLSTTPSITRAGLAYNRGKSLRQLGHLDEAAATIEQVVASVRSLGGPRHRLLLAALDELGTIYNLAGTPQKTDSMLGAALPDFAAAAQEGGDGERDCYAMALAALGEAARLQRRYDLAASHFAQAQELLARLDPDGFKDDLLDLDEGRARLALDRAEATDARSAIDRYETLLRRQSPVPTRRAATLEALRSRLAVLDGAAAAVR